MGKAVSDVLVDWSSTHPWLRPVCWLLGHAYGPCEAGTAKCRGIDTCYRCGTMKWSDESWGN